MHFVVKTPNGYIQSATQTKDKKGWLFTYSPVPWNCGFKEDAIRQLLAIYTTGETMPPSVYEVRGRSLLLINRPAGIFTKDWIPPQTEEAIKEDAAKADKEFRRLSVV